MAEPKANRVKAAKLRARKKLSSEQRKWLTDYNTRVAMSKAKLEAARPSSTAYTPTAPPTTVKREAFGGVEPAAGALSTALQTHVPVHSTVPPEGTLAATDFTWTPTVPPAPEGAEPPPPGAPEPLPEGAPLVDELTPERAPGDPAAAKQFAALCRFITQIGIRSALELAEGMPIPDEVKLFVGSEDAREQTLTIVGDAAERVAIKYGFRSIPLADEAIVVGAVGGSAVAFIALQKRKLSGKVKPKPQAPKPPSAPTSEEQSEVARLFAGSKS